MYLATVSCTQSQEAHMMYVYIHILYEAVHLDPEYVLYTPPLQVY